MMTREPKAVCSWSREGCREGKDEELRTAARFGQHAMTLAGMDLEAFAGAAARLAARAAFRGTPGLGEKLISHGCCASCVEKVRMERRRGA